jgi:hypothetical protein
MCWRADGVDADRPVLSGELVGFEAGTLQAATRTGRVLVYASDESSSFHERAIGLLETLAAGPDLVYLFWPVALGYLRISTHPAIFQKADIGSRGDGQRRRPRLASPRAHRRGGGRVLGYLSRSDRWAARPRQPRAGRAPRGLDAIWSHDRDFLKFRGIKFQDPFA